MAKVRVDNPQKFDVGVKTLNMPMGMNIKAGSFAMLEDNDVEYIMSISNLFQRGIIRLHDGNAEALEAVGVDVKDNGDFADDAEIRKRLGSTVAAMKKWLDTVKEPYMFDRIYEAAKEMNLPLNKLKLLQEKIPGKRFLDEE